MTVVDLLSVLFASPRFHFAHPRFFRLSIVNNNNNADGTTTHTPIDLDSYIRWPDDPLDWDMKLKDISPQYAKICLLPWTSVGDFTTVRWRVTILLSTTSFFPLPPLPRAEHRLVVGEAFWAYS